MKDIVTHIYENQEFLEVAVNLNKLKNIDKAKDNEKIDIICKAFINIMYNYKYNNKRNSYIYDFCVDNSIHGIHGGRHFNGEEIGSHSYSLGWSKYWDNFIDELLDEYDLDEYYIEISSWHGPKSTKLIKLIKKYLDDVIEYNNFGYMQIKFSDLIKKNVYESIYDLYKELVDKDFKL